MLSIITIYLLFYSILNPNIEKRGKKSANIWELEGEQEIFRDEKGCNWIQNWIKLIIITFYKHHPFFTDGVDGERQGEY